MLRAIVSFRQVCMNLCEGRVSLAVTNWWRTAQAAEGAVAGALKTVGSDLPPPRSDDAIYLRHRDTKRDGLQHRFQMIRSQTGWPPEGLDVSEESRNQPLVMTAPDPMLAFVGTSLRKGIKT